MTPELLDHFLVVAKYLNISKAAEALFMDNSSLGRQMTKLEDYFGVQLLIRSNRFVELTPAGKELAEAAPHLLKSVSDVKNRVRRASASSSVSLSIATLNVAYQPLFELYNTFKERNPGISLNIRNVEPGQVIDYVLNDSADIGVESSTKVDDYPGVFSSITIDKMEYCLMVNSRHPLAEKKSVSLEELSDEAFVVMDSKLPEKFLQAFKKYNGFISQLQESPHLAISWQDMVLQVLAGTGIALAPTEIAKNAPHGCTIVGIKNKLGAPDIVLFWKSGNELPALSAFVELASDVFA
jgi:LysR family positive regulator for ilvC